jgi:hypothetical protein
MAENTTIFWKGKVKETIISMKNVTLTPFH